MVFRHPVEAQTSVQCGAGVALSTHSTATTVGLAGYARGRWVIVMSTVVRWTGREACALRGALRMSIRVFAEHLGLAVRTVSKWEAGAESVVPQPDTQAILDTVLAQADPAAQERFAALCAASDGDVWSGSGRGPSPTTEETNRRNRGAGTIGDDLALFRWLSVSSSGGARIVSTWTALDMVSVSTSYRRAYRSVSASALLAATTAQLSLMLSLTPGSQPTRTVAAGSWFVRSERPRRWRQPCWALI